MVRAAKCAMCGGRLRDCDCSHPQGLSLVKTTKAEEVWIERLRRVLAAAPPTVWLYAADPLYVMRLDLDEDGEARPVIPDGTDPRFMMDSVGEGLLIDGGDW